MTIPKPINTATQKINMEAAHFILAETEPNAGREGYARRPELRRVQFDATGEGSVGVAETLGIGTAEAEAGAGSAVDDLGAGNLSF